MRPVQRLGACWRRLAHHVLQEEQPSRSRSASWSPDRADIAGRCGLWPGVADALKYIDAHGGVGGKKIALETVDYGYDPARAIETYKRWKDTVKPVAIQGWGTADAEALVDYVTKDGIVFMSGSSSGHLTDPTGRSPWTERPAPYNFFYGPSYSDGCRALVQWAAEQWKRTGTAARGSTFLGDLYRPKLTYMGDNHPYELSEGGLYRVCTRPRLRGAAAHPLFAFAGRFLGAVPDVEEFGRQLRFPRQHIRSQRRAGEGLCG